MDVLREVVLPLLEAVKKTGSGFSARCPAHEDRQASLSVSEGREHPVVMHCHAGCPPEDICAKLGLDWSNLTKPRQDQHRDHGEWTPYGEAVAVYDYRDEQGELLFQVCRTADKQFPVRVPDPDAKSGYRWKLGDTRKVIYRLPQVLAAVEECRTVYICEGEKDVGTLEAHGLVGTCNPGGAGRGKWLPEYSEVFRDAVVWIAADNDPPGQAHARAIRESLIGIAADITIAEAKVGKDVTDHFTGGYTLDDLLITWQSELELKPVLAPDLIEFLAAADDPYDWIVPGLLERGDRLILTGFEGLGKSMLMRQLAVCAAAGVNPFRHDRRHDPARVLLVDCENSQSQSRRKLRPIANSAEWLNAPVGNGSMHLIHRPEGIDLTREEDASWFLERVTAHAPDILFIGPFYRLHNANMNDEQVARRVVAVLDAGRAINNCALVTEAHAGHGEAGKSRSVRPTGSSLLLRWPEFGYGLAPSVFDQPDEHGNFKRVDFLAWRGPRDEREWPRHLEYGGNGEMPWRPWKPPAKEAKK